MQTSGWLGSRVVSVLDSGAEGSVQIAVATLLGNSIRQTVHIHSASVHQAAKLVAALLRVAGVTAGLAESNGSLLPHLWLTSPAGWLPRTGISSGTLRSVIEYGLPLPFLTQTSCCITDSTNWITLAHCRYSLYFTIGREMSAHLIRGSLGPTESISRTAASSV